MKESKEAKDLPFFARFLEIQEEAEDQAFPQVRTGVKAGMSLKYPSDRDEDW